MLNLKQRLLKLLYDHNEEHVGSCFSCIDIIESIYKKKRPEDIFVLSNGHAAYALYCILEKYEGKDADALAKKHEGHPHFDIDDKIYCTTGSLGQGITIAVGAAIASPNKKVYVTISDGECAEGSVWEALRYIGDKKLDNIEVHCNANGYACYDPVDVDYLERRLKAFLPSIHVHRTKVGELSILKGIEAHYMKLTKEEFEQGLLECQ
jgi:transketolase|tara:strand:- start:11527 stop:12150 length:624 start_codon:yes stop_codon:yes gene_type:complete